MSSSKYSSSEKLLSSSSASAIHSSVEDGNLQIQVPDSFKISDLDKMNRFKTLHTRLEKGPSSRDLDNGDFKDSPVSAMQDAQSTYETMMEIRKQLDQAYQEFMNMQ